MSKEAKNYDLVLKYVESIASGKKAANRETIQMCERFKRDLENPEYELKPRDPEFVIGIIEGTFVHDKGERLDGTPLRGEPFLLEPWQKTIVYNLVGFYHKGTMIRRFKEAFIMIPRKNGKTRFAAALAWALSLLERLSGSTVYIVGNALRQAKQSFEFILFNLREMGEQDNFRIRNNNQECSIVGELGRGSLHIEALAANPDSQDSLNCNVAIADELHAYKSPKQYNIIKEAMKAYTNKLMIGITTAGDNMNSFCYNRMKYCQKILDGTIKDEQYYVFIAKADEDDQGNVDYLDPVEHEKANPNYGVTIRKEDILNDARQAQNDPQVRKDFLAKSLNIYTSAMKAYFNIDEFRHSDSLYNWTIDELAKMKIDWYGGADLSKMYDLSAPALYGRYGDVDIAITHAFFPVTQAHRKAEEDNIPLFGWEDDGWLTMSQDEVINYADIVNWFIMMRDKGFDIKQVGYDRKFAQEFFIQMKKKGFNIIDEPQYYHHKSQGFRRIEAKAKDSKFYYLHSSAYEYCLQNVKAIEKTDDMVQYSKVSADMRIDLFDASVFACVRMLNNLERESRAEEWLRG